MINNYLALFIAICKITAFVLVIWFVVMSTTKRECKKLDAILSLKMDSVKKHCIQTVNDNAELIVNLVKIEVDNVMKNDK